MAIRRDPLPSGVPSERDAPGADDPPSAPDRDSSAHLLRGAPAIDVQVHERVRSDFNRFARGGLPADLEAYMCEAYNLDVAASYAGFPLRNPWGKASGQLSLRLGQVREAAEAGLGFVVLKTVIAEDDAGGRSMGDWAVRESRMIVEPIVGRSGAKGWTATWKGRGWWQSLEEYVGLVRESAALGQERGLLVVPSVKYHLPAPGEDKWRVEEYAATTRRLLEAYPPGPMPIEKDFSPTLAGSEHAQQQARILEWLRAIPGLIRCAAAAREVRVGLKLFNALFDDAFQLEMLKVVHEAGADRPDFLVYANRLFDPNREFAGHKGVAYGGPDLSDRNLRILSAFWQQRARGAIGGEPLPISATGDITSGRIAVEYLLRGCTSFQVHTGFQLPPSAYPMRTGSKLERALHRYYFDPVDGLIVWALHAAQQLGLGGGERLGHPAGPSVRLLEIAARGTRSWLGQNDSVSG